MIERQLDHSALFGAARHQGMRLTCLAFAMSDLNRQAANAPDFLSAEFLYQCAGSAIPGWTPGDGLLLDYTLQAVASPGQPLESDFPYGPAAPTAIAAPSAPAGAAMYSSSVQRLNPSADVVVNSIRRGHAVGLVVACTETLYKPVDGRVEFTPMIIPNALHAVLAVGVGQDMQGEDHILIRNSWGVGWGIHGHAWLCKRYIGMHAQEAFGR